MQAIFVVIDWIGQQVVTCEIEKLDRCSRHLAHCRVGGEDVVTWLAENGWGVLIGIANARSRAASTRAQQAERGIRIMPFVMT